MMQDKLVYPKTFSRGRGSSKTPKRSDLLLSIPFSPTAPNGVMISLSYVVDIIVFVVENVYY